MVKIATKDIGGGFILPAGHYEFKVTEIDTSKYEDFGKLAIIMTTKSGQTHRENFQFTKANGSLNEGAQKAWSFWVGAILGKWGDGEVDSDELLGKYFECNVSVEDSDTINEKTGNPYQNNRLSDIKAISGFSDGDDEGDASGDESDDGEDEDLDF